MSETGIPAAKSPLVAAAERLIQILTEHPELEATIRNVDIYGPHALVDTGDLSILAVGKGEVLDQWVAAIDGRIALEGRDLPKDRRSSWLGSTVNDAHSVHVTVATTRDAS